MKKIIILLISIVFSVFCLELFLQIIKPEMLFDSAEHEDSFSMDEVKNVNSWDNQFFRYLYIDIYDSYLKLDKDNIYRVQRINPFMPDEYKNRYFKKKKDKDVKRIFIIGESVADFYPKKILEDNLKQFLPNEKFEVINAGTCSYESVRINKILNEIVKCEPDYVIVCIGNNDGLYKPIEINYFPYKYKLFRTSYVLNRLSNFFVKRRYYDIFDVQPFFKKNIIKMVMSAKNKCPIIFVTLPRNLEFNDYDSHEFLKVFPLIATNRVAEDEPYIERRKFLKSLPQQYNWVKVIDYDKELKKYTFADYNVFVDLEHYHDCFYDVISKMFCNVISSDIKFDINKQYIDNLLKEVVENYIPFYHKSTYFADAQMFKVVYMHNVELFLSLFNTYYKEKLFPRILPWLHILILYNNDKNYLFSCFTKLDKLNVNSYEYYFLKALAYYKYNNINMVQKNLDIANKILNEDNNLKNLKNITIDDFKQCEEFWATNNKK